MSKRDQLDAHDPGELARDLGLADAGRAGEQVAADRLLRVAQAGARQLDRARQRLDRPVLAEHHRLELAIEVAQHLLVAGVDVLDRHPRHLGDHLLDVLDAQRLAPLTLGLEHLRRADLVDHVDRLVGQLAVVDVARRQLDRRLDRAAGVADLVMVLERRLEAHQDLDGLVLRGLVDVDLLEAADQGAVLLEVVAILLVGRRADAAQAAAGERRLEQVRGVERAAAGRAGADHGVDLVDEQDRPVVGLELGQHALEALLEVAAVARAGEQRPHVELEDDRGAQHVGHLAAHDPERQPLRDGGLADPRIADEQRVVLGAAAEDLDGPLDLEITPDQDVDLALLGLGVEIGAVGAERLARLAGAALLALLGAAHPAALGHAGALGDAVTDVVDGIEPRHVLLLQEIDGVGLALREQRDQDVGAGHLAAPRTLDMDRGALDDALEARRRFGVDHAFDRQAGQIVIEKIVEAGAQAIDLDRAGLEHRHRVVVVDQRHEQMLEGRVLVLTGIG